MKRTDLHHLCYPRKKWSRGYAHALRNYWYLRVEIPKDTLHAAIHHALAEVPIPRGLAAKEALEHLALLNSFGVLHKNDPIEKRLKLLIALFDCIAPATANAFRKQLKIVTKFNSSP